MAARREIRGLLINCIRGARMDERQQRASESERERERERDGTDEIEGRLYCSRVSRDRSSLVRRLWSGRQLSIGRLTGRRKQRRRTIRNFQAFIDSMLVKIAAIPSPIRPGQRNQTRYEKRSLARQSCLYSRIAQVDVACVTVNYRSSLGHDREIGNISTDSLAAFVIYTYAALYSRFSRCSWVSWMENGLWRRESLGWKKINIVVGSTMNYVRWVAGNLVGFLFEQVGAKVQSITKVFVPFFLRIIRIFFEENFFFFFFRLLQTLEFL